VHESVYAEVPGVTRMVSPGDAAATATHGLEYCIPGPTFRVAECASWEAAARRRGARDRDR
jgi:hypothetical protein